MNPWIEAMRLRTLPVSVAGVFAGTAYAVMDGRFKWQPALLCLAFAVLAQISSNFANEYYDFKQGLDRKGRSGPRRGVTEGDITPQAMRNATYLVLALACAVGLTLTCWGGIWLIAVGALIALGVLAYSAGPYPLSQHALGEVAVILFFGVVPVVFTYYLQAGTVTWTVFWASVGVGLMGSNILIVNNYRDLEDDAAAGKVTTAVKFGRKAMATVYLVNGYLAVALMLGTWAQKPVWAWLVPAMYLCLHNALWSALRRRSGAALTPVLGMTAMLMLAYCIGLLA